MNDLKQKNKITSKQLLGICIISFLFFIGIVSIFYTPFDPNEMDISNKLSSPSFVHLLGTDQFGRDVLSRIMVGAKLLFIIGIPSVSIALLTGLILGSISGYFGGILDDTIMKLIEAKMAFPGVLLALMLICVFSSTLPVMIAALSLMSIPKFTRVIRSGYIQYRSAEFVEAAKALGAGHIRIMFLHILPNIMPSIWVTCSLSFATTILAEAGLSYLGLGVSPPHASWGKMLGEAQMYMFQSPLTALIPGIMLTLVVLGFNLLADSLSTKKECYKSR